MTRFTIITILVVVALTAGAADPPDTAAREMLKAARAARDGWGGDFPGFQADLEVFYNNQLHRGTVTVSADAKVQVDLADPLAKDWASGSLSSLAMHSRKTEFEKTEGRYAMTFGADDHNPLGRLIELQKDPYHSSYRVRDNSISQVNRRMGTQHFTIDILQVGVDQQGRKTSQSFVVNTFDNDANRFVKSEAFRDEFVVAGGHALPKIRCVVVTEPSGLWVESVELSRHRLLNDAVTAGAAQEGK